MDRVPGPLDPTRDSFDLTARERVREGFAGQFRLNLPPEALLPPSGAVKPLGVFLPPQLPRDLRDLPLDQRGRGPLGAQQLQPVQLWILNPIRRMLVQVWVSPLPPPAGFALVPAQWNLTMLLRYDMEKAKQKQTPPPQASPTDNRKVAVKASVSTEFSVTKKPDGEKEQSAELSGGLEFVWEFYEGKLGSAELVYKTEVAFEMEKGQHGPWKVKPPEFKPGAEVGLSTPEVEFLGAKWKVGLTGEVYAAVGYGKGAVGVGASLGLEAKVGKRTVKLSFKKALELDAPPRGPDLPSDVTSVGLSVTFD